MLKLHLGEDESETYGDKANTTPGTVGSILEAKYGLYSAFFDYCSSEITGYLEEAMAKRLDSLLSRDDLSRAILEEVGTRIEDRFRWFLTSYEAESLGLPNTPTGAAMAGTGRKPVHRRRPSFVDTDLLKDAFRAWITEQ